MAKIMNFPSDWRKYTPEDRFLIAANDAICADTDESIIDGEEIERRFAELKQKDTFENRSYTTMGFLFFNDVIIFGNEKTWRNNKIDYNGTTGYAVYTTLEKLPPDYRSFHYCFNFSVRFMLEKLKNEKGDVDIYVNPGDKEGFIFSLALLREAKEIADQAIKVADALMKEGLDAKKLTDKMFERFDLRTAEITLADGQKLVGEIEAGCYGSDPDAYYDVTLKDGKEMKVYRKDIVFIKEL